GTTSPAATLDVNGTLSVGGRVVIDASGQWVGAGRSPQQIATLRWYEANETGITYACGNNPLGIAFDGANLWVANNSNAVATTVRASDGTMLGSFPVGVFPSALAFDGAFVWVTCSGSNAVTKVRASNGDHAAVVSVNGPFAIAFDGANVWVTSAGNTVT